jgi:hypothetical protein
MLLFRCTTIYLDQYNNDKIGEGKILYFNLVKNTLKIKRENYNSKFGEKYIENKKRKL